MLMTRSKVVYVGNLFIQRDVSRKKTALYFEVGIY